MLTSAFGFLGNKPQECETSEEVMTTRSPNSSPRNVQKFTVKIMDDRKSSGPGSQRAGSPKPQKRFSVHRSRKTLQGHYHQGYNPHMFTITAYLPHDGGRRLKLQCTPGMTVQQVIETEIPDISRTGYQVYQFPSRALLNPEKDASVLQDQEISIEPMKLINAAEVDDERLAIAKEILRTEDAYLENLRNIFDIYMEPLRKWGLPQTDMNTLFRSLSRLCDLLMNFFSELELAIQYWNTNSTLIGGLFKQYPSFWDMYDEYAQSYTRACRLLKEKRLVDESFNRFLEMKRGAAMHTLESLMLLPVQRIHDYHRLLLQLYSITPKDHPDYHDLKYTVACVSTLVQARERQLNQYQNETKLEQVQLRFPHDTLVLGEALEMMETTTKKMSKNMSSPSISRSQSQLKKNSSLIGVSPSDSPVEQTDIGKRIRLYLQEGPAKIITGLQTHDRYLFLFDDLLLISKPTGRHKSQQRTYKLKHRLRLSELWVTDCVDEVLGTTLPPDTAFVIGWPITNCVASFGSSEEKHLWHNLLSKNIAAQRQAVHPDSISIRIVNLTKSSNNLPIWMQVHSSEQARDVLSRALDLLAIAVSESNCQLWLKYSKEEAACPLIGHEYPFAIQTYHNRQQVEYLGDSRPTQLQFLIKRKSALSVDSHSTPQQVTRFRKPFRTANLFAWYRGKRGNRDAKKYRVFGAPLDTIIINGQLPEILQEMLIRLYTDGPTTLGIFRQSANHRKVKEMKEAIDNREQVDLSDVSIHQVGALLKEILRNVPGGILLSSRYTEFVATNDFKDVATRAHHIQRVLAKLPEENYLFLSYLMPLLHYISTKEEINCMNSINLAICFSPSLLWPDSGLDVIKNEVPPLMQFMIEHCPKIFGPNIPELYRQANLPLSPSMEKMELVLDNDVQYVPTKVEDGSTIHHYHHKRSDSMDTSTSEESFGEDEEEPASNLRKARGSGLTLSDSQLSVLSYQIEEEVARRAGRSREIALDGRHIAERRIPSPRRAPSPKRQKRLHPERSNSYRSPSERLQQRTRHRSGGEHIGRRKSIATQTTLERPRKRQGFVADFDAIPPSSNDASSQGKSLRVKPQRMERIDDDDEGYLYHSDELPRKRQTLQSKRRTPQYSHSFSKDSENKPQKPAIPTSASTSFYDKLLPLEPEVRGRSRSLATTNVVTLRAKGHEESLEDDSLDLTWTPPQILTNGELHEPIITPIRPPVTTTEMGKLQTSSQSVTSSRSASSSGSQRLTSAHAPLPSRPSNLSLASSHSGGSAGSVNKGSGNRGSGGSMNRDSPDLLAELEQTPLSKIDREFVKVAISKRFGISSTDWKGTPQQEVHGTYGRPNTSTPYSREPEHSRVKSTKPELLTQEEISMRKMQARKHIHNPSLQSYQKFTADGKKKGVLKIVMESTNFDDRPESEQHLNSLPRPNTAEFIRPPHMHAHQMGLPEVVQVALVTEEQEQDPNKLYPGYNSDTESSPSRTLSRPEKLKEVSSPPGKSMPHRYKTHSVYPGSDRGRSHYQQLSPVLDARLKFARQLSAPDAEAKLPTKTLEAPHQSQQVSAAVTDDRVASVTRQASIHKVINVGQKKVEESEKEPEEEFRERTLSEVEDGKVKLGMLPRRRAKSTSENEAMRIIHKLPEEPSEEQEVQLGRSAAEGERAKKHEEWLSCAPTSSERRRAWEQRSKSITARSTRLQTRELRSRSLRQDLGPNVPAPVVTQQHPSITTQHKSSTMPECLSTSGGRNGSRRMGMVRTVKITSYTAPEPMRIRRINLRTYY